MDDKRHLTHQKYGQDPLETYRMPSSNTQLDERKTTSAFRYGKRKSIESRSIDNLDSIEHNRQQKYLKQIGSVDDPFEQDKERKYGKKDVVRGTTYLFLPDDISTDVSFKKVQLSSVRIPTTKYPTLSAIQTLQYQRTQRNMRGHACMINHHGKWKLFFVWNSSLIHLGSIIGYMYDGHQLESKNAITLSL